MMQQQWPQQQKKLVLGDYMKIIVKEACIQ